MLAHYLAVALAKLRKAPFTSAANVLTLALGLACFIGAYGIASYWRAGDFYQRNAERIVVVGQGQTRPGEPQGALSEASNANVAPNLRADFPELEPIARAMSEAEVAVASGLNKTLLDVAAVDPEFLQVFQFDFIAGEPGRALSEPNGVVLTEEAAVRLFGDAAALGQHVLVNSDWDAVVTGVVRAVRQPSFMGTGAEARLRFDMLRTWQSRYEEFEASTANSWIGMGPLTFAVLPAGMSVEAFNSRLPAFIKRRVPLEQREVLTLELRALPLGDLTTHRLDNALFARAGSNVSTMSVLIGLGALTLLIACVNYANLATAQATARVREIGMRKALGAGRIQIALQTWAETAVLTVAAGIVALLALTLAVPVVRSQTGIDLLYFLSRGAAPLAVLAGLGLLVSAAASFYPALVLAGLHPVTALRSARMQGGPKAFARVLVGVQFLSASFLLILVIVAQEQRAHVERTALAPRQDPIVILNDLMPLDVDFATLKAELLRDPSIRSVSVVDRGPWDLNGENVMSYARLRDAGAGSPTAYIKSVDPDYFDALNLPMLAGRAFDADRDVPRSPFFATEPYGVVIDRLYAQRLGFRSPDEAIGASLYPPERFSQPGQPPAPPATVIGVAESEATRLDASNVSGNIYVFFPRAFFGGQHPIVRIARDDVADGVATITDAWDRIAPTVPANIRFFDDLFERHFATYARVSQIFMLLAGAAFAIASIGLLGMAVHITSRRRHEIGVRKVLGSTSLGIVRLLLIDFSKPVLIANLLAWPLGYLAANVYLSAFAERVSLTPAPFALSMAITLAIAWAAVIGEVLKAASVRPAEVLRHA